MRTDRGSGHLATGKEVFDYLEGVSAYLEGGVWLPVRGINSPVSGVSASDTPSGYAPPGRHPPMGRHHLGRHPLPPGQTSLAVPIPLCTKPPLYNPSIPHPSKPHPPLYLLYPLYHAPHLNQTEGMTHACENITFPTSLRYMVGNYAFSGDSSLHN